MLKFAAAAALAARFGRPVELSAGEQRRSNVVANCR
jgi:hypothetical protein